MAFGGTAKTYASWTLVGEPFKEQGREYILVIKPGTTSQKKVRWYSDKAHADLMPNSNQETKPLYKLFGFEDEEDYILYIRKIDLSEQEEKDYFLFNWRNGGKWTGSYSYENGWIAPKNAEIPPIKNVDKIQRVYWKKFKLSVSQ